MLVALVTAAVVAHSGVYGQIRIDPGSPVCRVGSPCWKPAAHAVLEFGRNGRVTRAKADANGRYRVALHAGTYSVHVERPRGVGAPKALRVVVPRDRYKLFDVSVDVGIR